VLAASDKVVATARNVTALDYLGANEKLQKLALAVTDESQGKKLSMPPSRVSVSTSW